MRSRNDSEYLQPALTAEGIACAKQGIGSMGRNDVGIFTMLANEQTGVSGEIVS